MKKISRLGVMLVATVMFLASTGSILAREAAVNWAGVIGAEKYHVYYGEGNWKTEGVKFIHAVRDLSKESRSITIGALKNEAGYYYQIAAVDGNGQEFWWSGVKSLGAKTYVAAVMPKGEAIVTSSPANYNQASLMWNKVEGAESYNVYYKKSGEDKYSNAVADVKDLGTTIRFLEQNAYIYQVSAVDSSKVEIKWSRIGWLRPTAMTKVDWQ